MHETCEAQVPSRCEVWRSRPWADDAGVWVKISPLWEPEVCALSSEPPDVWSPSHQTNAPQTQQSWLSDRADTSQLHQRSLHLPTDETQRDSRHTANCWFVYQTWAHLPDVCCESVNIRMSMAQSIWRRASVTGHCVKYNHSPNSRRNSTFCHWLLQSWDTRTRTCFRMKCDEWSVSMVWCDSVLPVVLWWRSDSRSAAGVYLEHRERHAATYENRWRHLHHRSASYQTQHSLQAEL